MHYAILGCIHGNIEALNAVLDDVRRREIDRVVCLGDIVGFGPNPVECLDVVRDACFVVIKGDHDLAMLTEKPQGFIAKTAKSLTWTRQTLMEGDPDVVAARMAFLEQGHETFGSAGITFTHGSPRSPYEYLFPSDVRRDPRKLRAAFAGTDKVTFCAHTHVPGVFGEEPLRWTTPQELDGHFHFSKGKKAIVNVGSVGQPRDGDPRACYLEIEKNDMFWRRVEYDVANVVGRLQSNEVFTSDLAIRLQQGR